MPSSVIVTPSTLFGSNLGMEPYFLEPHNAVALKLGNSLTHSLYDDLMPRYDLAQTIKPILFPKAFQMHGNWMQILEDYLIGDKQVMFRDSFDTLNRNWQAYVKNWYSIEIFARSVVEGTINIEKSLPMFINPEFLQRIAFVIQTTKSLMQHTTLAGYNFAWDTLEQVVHSHQPVTPKHMQHFLTISSFTGCMQQAVTLEWIRNIYEGYIVNVDSDTSIERNFI